MEFINIIKTRYSAKKFDGKEIPQEKINQLLEMIQYAPSSVGLQQFKVKIITDQETKEKLLEHSYNQEQITTCSHLLVFCAYTDFNARLKGYTEMMAAKGVPQEGIDSFTGMTKGFLGMVAEPQAALNWAARQAYIAMDHAMLGATSLGFDSCPMEGFNAQKYNEILALPENITPVVLLPVGYAADKPKAKIRFPQEELFF